MVLVLKASLHISYFEQNVIPRVAALLDVQPISDISGISDTETFIRPIYAGNAITTVKSLDSVKVLSVRGTAFEKAAIDGSAPIEDGNVCTVCYRLLVVTGQKKIYRCC